MKKQQQQQQNQQQQQQQLITKQQQMNKNESNTCNLLQTKLSLTTTVNNFELRELLTDTH